MTAKNLKRTPSSSANRSGRRPSSGRGLDRAPTQSRRTRTSTTSRTVPKSLSEETQAELTALQRALHDVQEELLLTDVQSELSRVETTLSLLPTEIEELRGRGYVFRSFLDRKVEVLGRQWDEAQRRASRDVARHTRELQQEAASAESALQQAMSGHSSHLARAKSAISTLERKASAAKSAVQAAYRPLSENLQQTSSQVEQIRWLLDQIDEAVFQLHPTEDAVMACKAQLMETKKDGPEGVLYLTDERLIFEQKEEVVKKKVLFIATEKETIQELLLDVPVGLIEEVRASDKGFLGRRELLELRFATDADRSGATVRLRGAENEEWNALIGRVKTGEIARERTQPKDEAVVEAIRAVPTKCSTCGATISVEIVRGMQEITCDYCGSVIRL